ncbi:MAG: hypothetical protein KIT11_07605 [Fimbriimonadaceae bacterium]|nr:hypothetical protein [Fimbriimonadaceae bacterium]QYK56218.1 MAG: hypothetical protein KF733_01795 [Fimbriimonadaceae bacterium]
MSFRVNTNIPAMGAFRNLSQSGMELSKSITRLSTGLRINSAADDPAGLIASENFRRQISGMDAALRNNQDALNYAKTADGALDEVSKLLRDARALAVANANSSVDAAQKQANQTQVNNMLASITRISTTTAFGNRKILNGTAGAFGTVNNPERVKSVNFTGTFGGAAMIANGPVSVDVTTVGEQATITGSQTYATSASTIAAGNFSVNGYAFTVKAGETVANVVDKVNSVAEQTGVIAEYTGTGGAIRFRSREYGAGQTINLTTVTAGLIQTGAGSASDAGVNAVASVTYDGATVTFSSGSGLTLRDSEGNQIVLTETGNATSGVQTGVIQVTAGESSFQIGANGDQTARLNLSNYSATALGLGTLDITGSDMTTALTAIDAAIATVSTGRANIGSFMSNTIESNVRSLSITKESLVSTESSIRDVDIAQEMTNYTRFQILQQSGLAVLAQANQAPQAVLGLLRG